MPACARSANADEYAVEFMGRLVMTSSQTLSESDRRTLARWAATCAEHVLPLFEAEGAADHLIRGAVARAGDFAMGKSTVAGEIRARLVAVKAASSATH
jgi:hypothetical protein